MLPFCGVKLKLLISPTLHQCNLFICSFLRQVVRRSCFNFESYPSRFYYLLTFWWLVILSNLQLYYAEFFLMHFVRWEWENISHSSQEFLFFFFSALLFKPPCMEWGEFVNQIKKIESMTKAVLIFVIIIIICYPVCVEKWLEWWTHDMPSKLTNEAVRV